MLFTGCSAPATSGQEPTTSATTTPQTATQSPTQSSQGTSVLHVDAVTPAVIRPDQTATVSGQIVAPAGLTIVNPTVRVVKSRQSLVTRGDVDAWASGTSSPNGTEIAKAAVPVTLAPGQSGGFTLDLPASALALSRSYGAVPIAVQVLAAGGSVLATVRTFVGWHRTVDYTPISLAWVIPVTLDANPGTELRRPSHAHHGMAGRGGA